MTIGSKQDTLTGAGSAPVSAPSGPSAPSAVPRAARLGRVGRRGRLLPYLLILPSVVAFVTLLGYPLYQVVRI